MRLSLEHLGIDAVMQMNKFLVSSRFLYGTVGKYRYPVAEFAGGQAVRDIDRCFSVNQVVELGGIPVFMPRAGPYILMELASKRAGFSTEVEIQY